MYLERAVPSLCDLGKRTRCTNLLLLLGLLGRLHGCEAVFEGNGERDERITGVVGVDPGFDFGQPECNANQ